MYKLLPSVENTTRMTSGFEWKNSSDLIKTLPETVNRISRVLLVSPSCSGLTVLANHPSTICPGRQRRTNVYKKIECRFEVIFVSENLHCPGLTLSGYWNEDTNNVLVFSNCGFHFVIHFYQTGKPEQTWHKLLQFHVLMVGKNRKRTNACYFRYENGEW